MTFTGNTPAAVSARAAPVAVPRPFIDYDFQTILKAPPKQRLTLWLMIALVGMAGLWTAFARVDVVVRANGRLAPSGSEIVVQPLDTSVVRKVMVRMGDVVHKGQILAVLDPTFTQADVSSLSAKLSDLNAIYDRLAAENIGRPYAPARPSPDESTQIEVWKKRQQEYAARLAASERQEEQYKVDLAAHQSEAQSLENEIKLTEEAEGIFRALVAKKLASKLKLIDTAERVADTQSRLATNLGEQRQLRQKIAQVEAERAGFTSEWQRKIADELAKTRADRDEVRAQLQKAKLRRRFAVLRAPANGTVLTVADRPAGSVVREAETLFRIVPAKAPLLADVDVETRDVAHIKIGDPVMIKFEALPWEQYGLARGVLTKLSPDTETDRNLAETAGDMTASQLKLAGRETPIHYRAEVRLTRTEFRAPPRGFAMRPGMRLVAEIKVGRRSILSYLVNPVSQIMSESLREP